MSSADRRCSTPHAASRALVPAGVACALAAWFLAAYYPSLQLVAACLGAAGAAALGAGAVLGRHPLARALKSRATRYGANSAVLTLAFLGVLVLANVLVARHDHKWDLTAGRLHTLSGQTVQLLKSLTAPVSITAFYQDGTEPREQMRRLLDDYRGETPRLTVRFVDPDKTPEAARQLGVREYGTTVFSSGSQTFRINQASEEAVTNALVRVTRKGKKSICFLAGHQEHALDDTQRNGYSTAKRVLEEQGFSPKELLLLRDGAVPDDCAVLVVPGPTKPVLDKETAALRSYLDRGGRVLLMIDPMTQPGLDDLLADWGAVLHDDAVIDPMSRLFGGSYTTPILTEYPPHDITSGFRVATFLPLARSLEAATPLPKGVTFSPIARTSPQAWGETNLKDERAVFDPKADRKGPLTAAGLFERKEVFAAANPKENGQLFVVGDSDFAANTYFGFSGNGDFFQNIVSYLAKEQDLISVRPKDARPTPLTLTRAQAATLFYGTVVLAPLATLLAGAALWRKRKNL